MHITAPITIINIDLNSSILGEYSDTNWVEKLNAKCMSIADRILCFVLIYTKLIIMVNPIDVTINIQKPANWKPIFPCHVSGIKYNGRCHMPQMNPRMMDAFINPKRSKSGSNAKPLQPNSSEKGPDMKLKKIHRNNSRGFAIMSFNIVIFGIIPPNAASKTILTAIMTGAKKKITPHHEGLMSLTSYNRCTYLNL